MNTFKEIESKHDFKRKSLFENQSDNSSLRSNSSDEEEGINSKQQLELKRALQMPYLRPILKKKMP